ncbi:MAG: NAD(P)H-dependent oxidoreductase [candidate division NC10 bacterium]|nr:NAD(P)H-dependent oxidoreductase [candidate division NC10 bacterium]MBI2116220.1 NAD(P)H-dependent oxidoreductase [candidate division NC10 bacterium]MBI2456894.1 NAD(P)H-dependent oxidoreductase [candidate division NC10 bacterium]MBI3087113.1 NAD(P)H-dependent oxidoreductase [candidate division NC10 bacterium]
MPITPKILAFAGSTRTDSYNKRLVKIAVAGARAAGGEVTLIDLRDFSLPLFDGDLESHDGLPANGRKLKDLFLAHHGLLISAPEYNSSITGVLKNTIDWVSRPVPGEAPLACFDGKVACLMSASPGGLGGLRGMVHVRAILQNIKVIVLPDQIAVPKAAEAFNPDGSLKDPKQQAAVEGLGTRLVQVISKLRS